MASQDAIAEALALLRHEKSLEALALLERVFQGAPDDPGGLALYAVLHAEQRGLVAESLEMCRLAWNQKPKDAHIAWCLGRVYLKQGARAKARDAFLQGLQWQPDHGDLTRELCRLGRRQRLLLPFLGRSHALNRLLGRLRYRWRRR